MKNSQLFAFPVVMIKIFNLVLIIPRVFNVWFVIDLHPTVVKMLSRKLAVHYEALADKEPR